MNTEQMLYATAGLSAGLLVGMVFALVMQFFATRPNQNWNQCDWFTATHHGGDGSPLTVEREPIPKDDGEATKNTETNTEPKTP